MKGRKGSALGQVRHLFGQVDPVWNDLHVLTGLSSGEGLIWSVRDPTMRKNRDGVDAGVSDKRLLVIETEFSSTLKRMGREGNTLSDTMRSAWDNTGVLRILTKNAPAQATRPHISIIGHITQDELRRRLAETEAVNGFGNRFLWVCVKRSQLLPEGSRPPQQALNTLAKKLSETINEAKARGLLTRSPLARQRWREIYAELAREQAGFLGAILARAEAHVLRLSGLYALMHRHPTIQLTDLNSAYAVWKYCQASAGRIFGEALGDPLADKILTYIQQHPQGSRRSEIFLACGRHHSAKELTLALETLVDLGFVSCETQPTAGRSAEVWTPVDSDSTEAHWSETPCPECDVIHQPGTCVG